MLTKKDISFIQPSRDNLKYLKGHTNQLEMVVLNHICVADDYSSDGTWEWCQEIMKKTKTLLRLEMTDLQD